MSKFVIDVEFATHETLKLGPDAPCHGRDGNAIDGTHRVFVLANGILDAIGIATQIVGATQGMPTAAFFVSCEGE